MFVLFCFLKITIHRFEGGWGRKEGGKVKEGVSNLVLLTPLICKIHINTVIPLHWPSISVHRALLAVETMQNSFCSGYYLCECGEEWS